MKNSSEERIAVRSLTGLVPGLTSGSAERGYEDRWTKAGYAAAAQEKAANLRVIPAA